VDVRGEGEEEEEWKSGNRRRRRERDMGKDGDGGGHTTISCATRKLAHSGLSSNVVAIVVDIIGGLALVEDTVVDWVSSSRLQCAIAARNCVILHKEPHFLVPPDTARRGIRGKEWIGVREGREKREDGIFSGEGGGFTERLSVSHACYIEEGVS
jgi:hypothetical protein